ncbi:UDP-galactose transporter HUT1 [Sporobolomyces koalae]|uniref:UDP-galactose transporter HUT1 n=1 Tax=Sporobolomyces koalae TaxID=500713 RepID=UPI00317CC328
MGAQVHTRSSAKLNPYLHFGICVAGIYGSFLVWAICQEKLSTTPYPSNSLLPTRDKFRSVTFINTVQSFFSIISSLLFLILTRSSAASTAGTSTSWRTLFGLPSSSAPRQQSLQSLLRLYALIALLATSAAPFGFLSLSHISFPTLLLGKSCKLVPVMLMNIVLYRRKFPLHKYLLVALVTIGIWLFMLYKPTSGSSTKGPARETSSLLGLGLLGVNLIMDGIVNSTQDQLFKTFDSPRVSGPQMMFFMNAFSCAFNSASLVLPFAMYPNWLAPAHHGRYVNELSHSLEFVRTHPSIVRDIVLFGVTGSIGQLFIFVTLSKYGSLTLVTITVTRKMMTMLLSVVVFEHELVSGQWVGVACVFVAVGIEAWVGIREKRKKPVEESHGNGHALTEGVQEKKKQ